MLGSVDILARMETWRHPTERRPLERESFSGSLRQRVDGAINPSTHSLVWLALLYEKTGTGTA